MKTVSTQAPAKIIIIGEHAVVYGYPAITATIDLFANCKLSENASRKINIVIPMFKIKEEISPRDIISLKEKIGLGHNFSQLIEANMTSLIKAILITLLSDKQLAQSFSIEINSEVPTGGFGSSSAVSAALIKALNLYFDFGYNSDQEIDLLCKGESLFQGYKVSGLDQISVFSRGINEFRKVKGRLQHKHIKSAADLFGNFLVIHTGKPENTTGEVVNYLAERRNQDNGFTDGVFEELGALEQKIVNYIEVKNRVEFLKAIQQAGELLIKLGIVRQKTIKLQTELARLGGATKVTGAGAISGNGSGAILCFADNLEPISDYLNKKSINFYKVKLV